MPTFDAALDFDGLELPDDAQIVISPYRLSFAMRFDWGTVGHTQPPEDRRLTETPVNPQFRVMVLAPDGSGRIYAMCDRIKPKRGDAPKSLLWLEEVDTLDEEVWRLDIPDGNPTLQVNESVSDISTDARSNGVFRALVIPQVLRGILQQALIYDHADPDGDSGDWEDWMVFLKQYDVGALPVPDNTGDRDADETNAWIDRWVNAFVGDRLHATAIYAESRA